MIPGIGSDLGCSTFQNPRKRGKFFFCPGLIPCHVGFVPLRLFALRSADCDYKMLLSGFTILDLSSSMAHGLPNAMQHAASCPRRVLVGTGYIHLHLPR